MVRYWLSVFLRVNETIQILWTSTPTRAFVLAAAEDDALERRDVG